MPITDNEYMVSVSEGNIADLGFLFTKYHRAIYRYFYRMSGNDTLSQDLTQSVFERILKYRNSYSAEHSYKAWMYRIAHNLYMDHFRENRIHLEEYTQQDVPESLDEHENLNSRKLALNKAICQLKDREQAIIRLTKIENLSVFEVASLFDMSESAVKVSVHRSIKKLRIIMRNTDKK